MAHTKRQKDKVRKSGLSLQNKTRELGRYCDVFSALAYWNPTHERMESAMHMIFSTRPFTLRRARNRPNPDPTSLSISFDPHHDGGDANLPDLGDSIDSEAFSQILEMDASEDDHEFS
ncbi:histidine phosphotransferase h.t1.c1p [Apiospora marii]|uniref:Histidine phosphotransferase h.t1.c1p n=1 Tax=Apiospora marii TaxID=335849 RepID=A0ABR1RKU8_9PEZI